MERGQVYLLRPGKMRWEYRDPPGKLAITDGERTHLYLPEDRQVVVAPVPPRGTGSGIAFLLRPRIDLLEENLELARTFQPMPTVEKQALLTRVKPFAGPNIEWYKKVVKKT